MSKKNIIHLDHFTLSYEPTFYRSRTLRDLFVDIIHAPFNYFFKKPERLEVLKGINLEIKKGDVVGILGANGVGKTSLCRYLAGIITDKNVSINGEVRAIFENNAGLYPDLTGRENASLLIELLYVNSSDEEKNRILEEAITFSELTELIDTTFKNFSRGMKARLYLALMTALPADLLIIDEAFDGMDQFFLEKLEVRMKNLIDSCGAVVIVSHKQDEIRKLCNRVIVLNDKKIAFDGDVNEAFVFYNSLELP